MYDIAGKQIHKETINDRTEGLKYARLETSQLAKGSYILEISTGQFQYTKKIIKQ